MGRNIKNTREEILAEINTTSVLIRKLWEEVFNEKITNKGWNELKVKVVDKMRQV